MKMSFYVYLIAVTILSVDFGHGQDFSSNCELKESCGDCIQEPGCVWCISAISKDGVDSSSRVHCIPLNSDRHKTCIARETVNPTYEFKIIHDKPLSQEFDPVQISPQRIKLAMRRGEERQIDFTYQQATNYPIDLYYVMDLSASMRSSKERLSQLGEKLTEAMRKKTNNFRIGFGSFVDKVTLPYVNTYPTEINRPCPDCEAPYSFKNHLSLTNSSQQFVYMVSRTKISGNLDSPEGGFDAMMQAMVCTDVIGWRSNSRHLLVVSTDAVSHIAGDGKLGGVVEPHDGLCHMEANEYKDYLRLDYPSVSQINHVARQNNINIIFAIVTKTSDTSEVVTHYKALSETIQNSKIGTLSQNSNNVVKFISDIYDEIRDSVRITSNASTDVSVKISSNCVHFTENGCSNVKPGSILKFTATIQPLKCVEGTSNKRYIKIKPEGLEESLIVELEVYCDCTCASKKLANSTDCKNQGDLECGICRCNEGRFGVACECDRTESNTEDTAPCIRDDGKGEICSGQGKCICGKCLCKNGPISNRKIYGKFCQCDDFSCPFMCSGRGTCKCGECHCDKEWTGPGCECPKSNRNCIAPGSDTICSNYGNCTCGECACVVDEQGHAGKYCEDCISCPAQRCEELGPCVECQVHKSGIYNATKCDEMCTTFKTKIEKEFKESQSLDAKKCKILDENSCTINFEYSYDRNNNLIVRAAKDKNCPSPPNVLAWIIGVIGTVLLAGIIMLIIWKIVTTVHDRREYAKFENERKNKLKWHTNANPLFKGATTTFANPAYNRSSQRTSVRNSQ